MENTAAADHAPSLWQRWRTTYAKLPPSLQLIGLQLWLPPLLHLPVLLLLHPGLPRTHREECPDRGGRRPVGGEPTRARHRHHFHLHRAGSAAAANKAVVDGVDIGALNLTDPVHPALAIASSHSYQAANIARQSFTAILPTSTCR